MRGTSVSYPGDPQQGYQQQNYPQQGYQQPGFQQQGQAPYEQAPFGQAQYGQFDQAQYQVQHWPEQSQATMVLVMGVLGLVFCQVCSPIAWIMGNKELEAIDAGRRPYDQRSTANVGRILGIVGTALILLVVVGVALMFILSFALAAAG